jgi:hypothetical protein
VVPQVPELAVHGHEVAGLQEREDQLLLLPGGVARDVYGRERAVEDLGAAPHEVVYGARDSALIARDRVRRNDDHVTLACLYGTVGAVRDAGEGRHWLALRARGEDGYVPIRDPAYLALVHQHRVGQVEVAQVACDLDVPDHRAARHADQPVVHLGGLDDLLDPVDVRGEGGDYYPAFGLLEDLVEGVADHALGGHVAGPLAVRRVAEVG